MSAAVRLNKKVTLANSSNQFLSYPCDGVIETAELDINGKIIWATFRISSEFPMLHGPVVVRDIVEA